MKRIRLKPKERLAQLTYLLKTRGPLSLEELARLMGYADKAGLQGLIRAHGLPSAVALVKVPAPSCLGGGGNWLRHMYQLVPEPAKDLKAPEPAKDQSNNAA